MAVQIDLGEKLIRLADRVLSRNTEEEIGQTGGITSITATDTSVPTTKAVKEYFDTTFNGHTHVASEVTTIDPTTDFLYENFDADYDTNIANSLTDDYGISPDANLDNYATYVNVSLNSKAPYSHASNDNRYGVASSTNYGHVRVIDNLTSTGSTDALSAAQGKKLNDIKLELGADTSLGPDSWQQDSSNLTCSKSWLVYPDQNEPFAHSVSNSEISIPSSSDYACQYKNNTQREIRIVYTIHYYNDNETTEMVEIIRPGELGTAFYSGDTPADSGFDEETGEYFINEDAGSPIYDPMFHNIDTISYSVYGNYKKINTIANILYPIGAIYTSTISLHPTFIFGGEWEQIKDRFLLASGNTYTGGRMGGEATHALTISEMPRHTHTQNAHSHSPSGDYDYFLATPGSAVNRNSTAGTSGTKVQDLLQSADGVVRTNTDAATPTIKYTGGSGTSQSASNGSAHNNMPPYLTVYIWKRIG